MGRLNGKIALVTGGTTGIGLATVQRYLEEGATVFATGSRQETVDAAQAQAPEAKFLVSDAGDPVAVSSLIGDVAAAKGQIDVIFLNAGIAKFAPLEETPDALLDLTLNINLKGPLYAIRAASPHLKEGASIIVNTSIVDVKGFPNTAAYAASKAGLRSIVRVAAAELAPRGVRVNAIAPGPVATPIYDKMGMPKEAMQGMQDSFQSIVPLGRFGEPREVAAVALFLASSEASFITGAEIPVDGGLAQV